MPMNQMARNVWKTKRGPGVARPIPPAGLATPVDDRRGDPEEHGDELVLRHEEQVVEPGLLAAADVVLAQPVEERAVGRDGAGGEPVEVGEEGGEEDREDHQPGDERRGDTGAVQPGRARRRRDASRWRVSEEDRRPPLVAPIRIPQAAHEQRRRGKRHDCQQCQRDRQRMGEEILVEGELLVLRGRSPGNGRQRAARGVRQAVPPARWPRRLKPAAGG